MSKQPAYWIKQDTREQLPLEFVTSTSGPLLNVVKEALPVGDYWGCWGDGTEIPVCFERKGLGDLWKTMTTDYDRFKRELERAKEHGLKIVLIIEGSMKDVLRGYKYSEFTGEAMFKKIMTLWVKYDLIPVFCNDRADMAKFVQETFAAITRNFKSEKVAV